MMVTLCCCRSCSNWPPAKLGSWVLKCSALDLLPALTPVLCRKVPWMVSLVLVMLTTSPAFTSFKKTL